MHVRRFEASTMAEAVRKVKEALGPDALVLSTRTVRRGQGWLGLLGRPVVELTAAVDRDARAAQADRDTRAAGADRDAGNDAPATEKSPAARGNDAGQNRTAPDRSWTELRATRALVDSLEGEMRALRQAVRELRAPGWDASEALQELAELRTWTAELARGQVPAAPGPGEARLAGRLLASGLAPRHAFALARAAARRPLPEVSPAEERAALREVLAERFDARTAPPRDDDGVEVELFVGPTGVGKTTTLAKLAAREGRDRGDVAVLTTDTLRVGAEAQLRAWADCLGVPFGVAVSPEDLAACLAARPARRVLVDTAGRGPDRAALAELARLREHAGPRTRVNLVLSATAETDQLRDEMARYRSLRPEALIVTKLDETRSWAGMANVLLDDDVPPLLWAANGQRVPEDLLLPEPAVLADGLLRDDGRAGTGRPA